MHIRLIPSIIDMILNEVWMAFQHYADIYYTKHDDVHLTWHAQSSEQLATNTRYFEMETISVHSSGVPLRLIFASPKIFLAMEVNRIRMSEVVYRSFYLRFS